MAFRVRFSWFEIRNRECDRCRNLCGLKQRQPVASANFRSLLWDYNRVAWQEHRGERISRPHAAVIFGGQNRTVGMNDKDGAFVCQLRQAASLSEIPLGTSAGDEANSGGTEDLAGDNHVVGFFRDEDGIAIAKWSIPPRLFEKTLDPVMP